MMKKLHFSWQNLKRSGNRESKHVQCGRNFFGYKTELFSFQNNRKNLDLSYKTDLDLRNCLGRVKLVF